MSSVIVLFPARLMQEATIMGRIRKIYSPDSRIWKNYGAAEHLIYPLISTSHFWLESRLLIVRIQPETPFGFGGQRLRQGMPMSGTIKRRICGGALTRDLER
jgi:hypothetical protein